MAPSLKGLAKGRRAFCGWDEDVVTMAVEAARECFNSFSKADVSELHLATTTSPFADVQSSAIVSVALQLERHVKVLDIGGSQRAGLAGFARALELAVRPLLFIGADRLVARPASVQEMQYGAGAAAFVVGNENVVAELIGSATSTTLFVDHFRSSGEAHDYFWEERWIRDEGYLKIATQEVRNALANAGVTGDVVKKFIFPSPLKGMAAALAKAIGVADNVVGDPLDLEVGYTGTAHALLMLADALDKAQPGDVIVAGALAQGCDVIVLRVTDAILSSRPERTVDEIIADGFRVESYAQMASFYGEISPEWGMRAERDTKTALTEQYRSSDQITGFLAGKCGACGQVQFPQLSYCVNCAAPAEGFSSLSLVDEPARVLTYTADALAYHPAPPLYAGFAQFDIGARLLMEFVDVKPETFDVGVPLRMRFRIKEQDENRGYKRYFWKAAPAF
jgi:3-hydroxy-3-methylglutaryl CoA synthase